MSQTRNFTTFQTAALAVGVLVPITLVVGSKFFSSIFAGSLWLFTIGSGVSIPLLIGIIATGLILASLLSLKSSIRETLGNSARGLTFFGFLISAIALLFAWNQSTLFGSGNILVGQIRQLPQLSFEWTWQIEHLYVALTRVFVSSGLRDDQSAYLVIRLTSVVCGLIAIPAFAGMLVRYFRDSGSRIAAMSLLLIPILPSLAGLPLREAVLIPTTAWILFFALKENRSFWETIVLFALALVGVWMHPWAVMNLPLVVAAILLPKSHKRLIVGLIIALAGVAFIISSRNSNIWLDRSLQSFVPPTALGADWVFGSEHLMTLLQVLILAVPCIFFAFVIKRDPAKKKPDQSFILVAIVASFSLFLILQLQQTVILDWPRLLPLLLPLSLYAALKLPDGNQLAISSRSRALALPAFLVVASLVWVLPLSKTAVGEDFVTHMAEVSEPRWVSVGLGLRDAYFLEQEFEEATYWENQLTTRSSDYLTWRGCYDLVGTGNYTDAIIELNQVLVNQQNWADPRAMLALAYARTNSPEPARAHLDTVLSFFRFDQQLLISRYNIEMQSNQVQTADSLIRTVRALYPNNMTIKTDQMIVAGRLGNVGEAVARADSLLREKPSYPAALRVRGMAAERNGQTQEAISWYQKYIEHETDMSQIAAIRSKISQLTGTLPDSAAHQ